MSRFSKLMACVFVLAIIGAFTAFAGTVDTMETRFDSGRLVVSGTTEDSSVVAVVVVIRNGFGQEVAMQTCSVYNGEFSTKFRNFSPTAGKYSACAADFEGGAWTSVEFSVSNTVVDVPEKPANTGTWNAPVTDGTWKQDAIGNWSYITNAMFRNTWGYIRNPYAKAGQPVDGWFYFDSNGKMLTGWQQIGGKWYYLNPVNDGTLGMCYLNTTTPDGYKVDANGARIQ